MASALGALAGTSRSVVVPAATASLAYINARYGVSSDLWLIYQTIIIRRYLARLESTDRLSPFYLFEGHALNPKSAGRPFLIVPSDGSGTGTPSQWTYAEAYDIVLKHARWLKEVHGVQKNEIVAMDMTNKPMFIWIWFALWSLGAKPAFINTNLRSNAFVHCVRLSTARLVLMDPLVEDALTEETRLELGADGRGRAVEALVMTDDIERDILAGSPFRAPDEARSGAKQTTTSLLIYTSGTTGLPKAANVPFLKPYAGVTFFARILQLSPSDRYFTAMPLYHSSASVLGVCPVLGTGCAIVIAPKFSPRAYMKQVCETEATVIQYIGEACRYLLSTPPSPYDKAHKLRVAFGNGMRPDVWQRFKDRFNIPTIGEFYGATEGPGASMVYERNGFLRGAIGHTGGLARLLTGNAVVLVKYDHNTDMPYRDPKTNSCVKCATNEPGELITQLDPANIQDKYAGYFGNDKASNSKILFDVFKKGDAYYRTGDLQRLDHDGRWWFVDRIGDTFRWKSENVSTAEVSEALGVHPSIHEANVYGVQLPNHDGRAGCAALGLADGKAVDDALRRELAVLARERLPRYAVPLFLRVMRELEVTGTMKHQKVVLRSEGVDPSKTGGDRVFWLQPGAEAYEPFGEKEWARLVGGSAKL